jgi:hypothetical protein
VRVLTLALAALLSACATAAPPASPGPAGTYTLVEMDGKPITPETEGEPGWIMDRGTVTLHADGRAIMEAEAHRVGQTERTVRRAEGTYTVTGTDFLLSLAPGEHNSALQMRGTLQGDRLSWRDETGTTAVFRRR